MKEAPVLLMSNIVNLFTKSATNGSGPLPTERQLAFGWSAAADRPVNVRIGLVIGILVLAMASVTAAENSKGKRLSTPATSGKDEAKRLAEQELAKHTAIVTSSKDGTPQK